MADAYVGDRGSGSAGSTTTLVITITGSPAAGDTIVGVAEWNQSGPTIAGVSDSRSNTWTVDQQASSSGGQPISNCGIFSTRQNVATLQAGDQVVVTFSSAPASAFGALLEFSGLLTASAVDANGAGGSSGTALSVSTSAATVQADELAVAAFGAGVSQASWTPDPAWTAPTLNLLNGGPPQRALVWEYQLLEATGTVTAGGTLATSTRWCGAVVTYKALTGGGSAPANTTAPAVTGTTTVGQTLSTTNGTWTDDGSPAFTYQWQRDNHGGGVFSNIPAAVQSSYKLTDADDGCQIRCLVTDTDAEGATVAASNTVGTVIEPAPANSVAPVVTGTTTVGQTLSVSNGTWQNMGGSSPTFTYQWQRDTQTGGSYGDDTYGLSDYGSGSPGSFSDIAGATAALYTLTDADDACDLVCVVTAHNTNPQTVTATSNEVGPVVEPAPVNTVAPALSTTSPSVGSLISVSNGTWQGMSGNQPSFTYQWQSSPDGTTWTNIASATASSYTPVSGDLANELRCQVTAHNTGGTGAANSNASNALGSGPSNTVAPAVTGTTTVGQTLTTTSGTWSGSPTSFSYQWQRDGQGNGVYAPIQGAASSTSYTLVDADDACRIRCVVTATSSSGSSQATSNAVGPVVEPAPVNTAAPVISSSTPQVGVPIGVSTGTWTHMGGAAPSFTYQWQSSPTGTGSWTNIGAATGASYQPVIGDVGKFLRCVVTAHNTSASAVAANSNAAGPVTPQLQTNPVFTIEIAFQTDPGSASPIWTDISPYVKTLTYQRGRQHELDEIQAGTCDLTLNNSDRRFDPDNTAGPYYPNVLPIRRLRVSASFNGTTYRLFSGYVERWPRTRKATTWSEIQLTAVDGFEWLGQAGIVSATAAFTTTLTGANNDLVYTAAAAGAGGNAVTITYVVSGTNKPLTIATLGTDITVNVATDGSGNPTSTATQVMNAVNADATASGLVVVSLAPGSDGTGVVAAMSKTPLTGGTFIEQLSGARINAVLDAAGWPTADRAVDAGQSLIQPGTFNVADQADCLQHIRDVTASETGLFFCDGQGRAQFLDRHALISSPYTISQATFSDAPAAGEIGYADFTPSDDKDLIFNDWQSKRQNATTTVEAQDATSIGHYFRRTQTLTPLTTSDLDSLAQVQFELSRFKDPHIRYDALVIRPGNNTARWQQVLGREIGDRITVKETTPPGGGAPVVTDQHIQQITLTIQTAAVTSAECSWSLLSADSSKYLIHDDPVFGALDANAHAY